MQGPQLNNLVYEQWLMADLREMAEPSLPENLHQIKGSHKLTGTFVLQVRVQRIYSVSVIHKYGRAQI